MPSTDTCPHCGTKLTLKQMIEAMNGSGFIRYVQVQTPDGRVVSMQARDVNPREVTVIER